jgi:hypothetical protein
MVGIVVAGPHAKTRAHACYSCVDNGHKERPSA